MSASPVVSVVLPTFNNAETIRRAVHSVAAQTFRDWELIVIDDGSTDATPRLLMGDAACLGNRMRVIRQDNAGPGAARNVGIDAARGIFVAFLDADDTFLPVKLARQLEFFQAAPQLGLVFSDYGVVGLDGMRHLSAFATRLEAVRNLPVTEIAPRFMRCDDTLASYLAADYIVSTITGIVRRDVLGTKIRFANGLLYSEEWLFFCHVAEHCAGGFVDESLSLHFMREGSVSRTDILRNNEHQIHVLAQLKREQHFGSRADRRLRSRLAMTHRQLGMDYFKRAAYGDACRSFGRAFRQVPQPRDLLRCLKAMVYWGAGSTGRAVGSVPSTARAAPREAVR